MRFVLDDSLFKDPENFANIYEFINSASRKINQVIMINNPSGPDYLNFRKIIGERLFVKSDFYLSKTLSAFNNFKSPIYRVVGDEYVGSKNISILTALDYINRPFYIYLENDRNDQNFLKFFCDERDLKYLNNLENSNELQFYNGGGIGELKVKVMDEAFNKDKSFVVFDSDSLPLMKEKTMNANAVAIKNYAEKNKINFHMLNRRFIESYLPHKSLHKYVYSKGRSFKRKHSKLLNAFVKIDCSETKNYFNLKKGILGDAKRYEDNIELAVSFHYKKLDPSMLKDLMDGFGEGLSKSYEDRDLIITEKMKDREAWEEVNGVIKSILRVI